MIQKLEKNCNEGTQLQQLDCSFAEEQGEKETSLQCSNLHTAACKQELEYKFYYPFK